MIEGVGKFEYLGGLGIGSNRVHYWYRYLNLSNVKKLTYFETTTITMARISPKSIGYLAVVFSRRLFSVD
jgi:hypothetical protein